jgi:Predicted nucleic acid-binding protein, contains PIN domain
MTRVVDASVACKWFIEERGSLEARQLLVSGEPLIAPQLVVAEVCSVAWKKVRAQQLTSMQAALLAERIESAFNALMQMSSLAPRALNIAVELDHPVYDCFYLALTELEDVPMVTADQRLLMRLQGTTWEHRVVSLYVFTSKV